MDWTAAKFLLDLAALAVACATWLYARHVKREQAGKKEFGLLKERVIKIEAAQQHAPNREETHKLSLCVSEMGGDMKAVVAKVDGLGEVVKRIETIVNRQEEYLLNRTSS